MRHLLTVSVSRQRGHVTLQEGPAHLRLQLSFPQSVRSSTWKCLSSSKKVTVISENYNWNFSFVIFLLLTAVKLIQLYNALLKNKSVVQQLSEHNGVGSKRALPKVINHIKYPL